jgi:hypothetical protein
MDILQQDIKENSAMPEGVLLMATNDIYVS